MNSALKQSERVARLETPFGEDVLVIEQFDGHEGLGELFEFRIQAFSEKENLDFDKALGQKCQVIYKCFEKERVFNGYLVEAEWLGVKDRLFSYRLVLRPWLWLLSRKADCRIFEKKNALDIIEEIFKEHGHEFRTATTESYPELEYCVQYRETDLAFVSRLMEQHGIYYFFEHEKGKHTLVLADGKSSHKANPDCPQTPFIEHGAAGAEMKQYVSYWSTRRRLRTGKIEFKDYNFEQPTADMVSKGDGPGPYSKSDMQIYDYPGKYKQRSDGEKYAKVWLESEQALDQRRHANGEAANLFPGSLTTLARHTASSENVEYLIIRTSHAIAAEAYVSGVETPDFVYTGSYEFQPSTRVFRMPLVTPEPHINGIQTAMVIADDDHKGEEIAVDKHGRIRVEFHWVRPDRSGKKKPSCWIRCAQMWSGKGWGGQFIPRVGMEVVVEFLEGDPDRPIIVGTVYNADYKHPYELPDKKTQSGIKTDSSKGHSGHNELRFEDKAGSEEIYMRAQKYHKKIVRRKETTEIGEEIGETVTRDVKLVTGNDELEVEKGSRKVTTLLEHKTISKLQIAEEVLATTAMLTPASIELNAPTMTVTAGVKTLNVGVLTLNGNFVLNGTLIINGSIMLNGKPMV